MEKCSVEQNQRKEEWNGVYLENRNGELDGIFAMISYAFSLAIIMYGWRELELLEPSMFIPMQVILLSIGIVVYVMYDKKRERSLRIGAMIGCILLSVYYSYLLLSLSTLHLLHAGIYLITSIAFVNLMIRLKKRHQKNK